MADKEKFNPKFDFDFHPEETAKQNKKKDMSFEGVEYADYDQLPEDVKEDLKRFPSIWGLIMGFGVFFLVEVWLVGVMLGGWVDRKLGGGQGYIEAAFVLVAIVFALVSWIREVHKFNEKKEQAQEYRRLEAHLLHVKDKKKRAAEKENMPLYDKTADNLQPDEEAAANDQEKNGR